MSELLEACGHLERVAENIGISLDEFAKLFTEFKKEPDLIAKELKYINTPEGLCLMFMMFLLYKANVKTDLTSLTYALNSGNYPKLLKVLNKVKVKDRNKIWDYLHQNLSNLIKGGKNNAI